MRNTPEPAKPEAAGTPQAAVPSLEWVTTVAALARVMPALGSPANINRLIVMQDGLPHRRLGGRLLFNLPEISAWLQSKPVINLPQAS